MIETLGRIASRLTTLAPIAVLGIGAGAIGGAQLRLLSPLAALAATYLAMLAGGLVAVVSGLTLCRSGLAGPDDRRRGMTAAGIGMVLLAVPLVQAFTISAPPIHDIATDLEDPPVFRAAQRVEANAGRDLSYPADSGSDTPSLQREAYPDVAPIRMDLGPDEAFEAALRVADELGWTVTWTSPSTGVFEAHDQTALFRFVDDVVVRVRPTEGGTIVDVRSTSRVGRSDLGANAARIRRFTESLLVESVGRS